MDETANDADVAADLRARLERGELRRERLTLARALGHRPSGLALGREEPTADEALDPETSLEFWGRRLGRWGPPAMLRVSAALAHEVVTGGEAPPAVHDALEAGLAVTRRFLARADGADLGGEGLSEECQRAAKALARAALTVEAESHGRRACQVVLPLLRAIGDLVGEGAPDRDALRAHYLRTLEQAEAALVDNERLQAAARRALLTWALG